MSRGKKRIIQKDDESSKVIQFPDPIENLHQTLNLLKLPAEVSLNTKSISELHEKIDSIQEFLGELSKNIALGDRYMPPKEAIAYLGVCPKTFDKYRYETKVRIKGYKLDGMNLYKKSDLDLFMMTYEAKSKGFA